MLLYGTNGRSKEEASDSMHGEGKLFKITSHDGYLED